MFLGLIVFMMFQPEFPVKTRSVKAVYADAKTVVEGVMGGGPTMMICTSLIPHDSSFAN